MTPNLFDSPQLDLLGGQAEPAQTHRLFFALLPDEATRAEFARVADTLKASQPGLRARWVAPARYHATVHFLGDHPMLRGDIVQAATRAGAALQAGAFDWTLDCIASFHGREPPCVLRSNEVPAPLQQLWVQLREALIRAGQGAHLSRSFTPHVTLGYSRGGLLPELPVGPLAWRVDQLALVHSVVGQGDYRLLHAWPLS
ncbi:2'-5' RNA ligase family protein [Dyella sp. 2RAB6]|uniref:2'-5' RNA ligase family protein n=1 Tax=Dyella sp. 2RAB6 TaxID=3232992 RepID=UPI003F92D4EC